MQEESLRNFYDETIVPFWNDNGKPKTFDSTVDRVPIAAMEFRNPAASAAIVISNGRTESFIKYKELVYELYQDGYSVYLLDHRGQGLSGRVLSDPEKQQMGYVGSFDDYVTDLRTFVTTFVKPAGHARHALLCHSMGGAIGALYLERFSTDFDCAVLSSPMLAPNIGDGVLAFLSEAVIDLLDNAGESENYAPGKGGYDDDAAFENNQLTHSETRWDIMRREFGALELAKLGGPSVHWVSEAIEAGRRAGEHADQVAVPVLLVQAGADSVVTAEAQGKFYDNLNRRYPDRCRLLRVEGAWHELFIEQDRFRDQALAQIRPFIASHTRP